MVEESSLLGQREAPGVIQETAVRLSRRWDVRRIKRPPLTGNARRGWRRCVLSVRRRCVLRLRSIPVGGGLGTSPQTRRCAGQHSRPQVGQPVAIRVRRNLLTGPRSWRSTSSPAPTRFERWHHGRCQPVLSPSSSDGPRSVLALARISSVAKTPPAARASSAGAQNADHSEEAPRESCADALASSSQ